MNFSDDESGITYGTVMFFIAIFLGIFIWAIGGIVVDEMEIVINDISYMISPSLLERVEDISDSFSYLPFMILSASVVYLIVRGLRRDEYAAR